MSRSKSVSTLHKLAACLLLAAIASAQGAETRVALVIGNGNYANAPPLSNPANDAKLVAQSLRTVGFTVTLKENASLAELQQGIAQFGRAARVADVALVYYAGHGIQMDGDNYLVPVDAKLEDDIAVKLETISLDVLLDSVAAAKTRLIVLDACRNNPFSSRMRVSNGSRSISRGLAVVQASIGGTLIAFSTSPGDIAEDGSGKNSTFATALAQYLPQPGLEIRQVFTRVRQAVATATDKHQTPWENSSLFGDVFLNGGGPNGSPTPRPEPTPLAAPATPRIDGSWTGTYTYMADGGSRTVPFSVTFSSDHGRLLGSTTEPNTFGGNAPKLSADIIGSVKDGELNFTKTYDGKGGYSHSVEYEGNVDRDGKTIAGTWTIHSQQTVMRGKWSVTKQ
jgi:hypothetical protein